MKKLSILCAVIIVFGAGYARAQPNYQVDVAGDGDKSFVNEVFISVCEQETLHIYLADAGAPQQAGGAWIDFASSSADISYVSGGRCLTDGSEGCTGPWDPAAGFVLNEPAGVGTVMYVVANLSGGPPDAEGDLIVGSITLESAGCCHDATIAITTIPDMRTWVPIDDAAVVPGTLVIHQVCGCTTDANCDDGQFCNGIETCDAQCCTCLSGTPPCDDGDRCTLDCDEDTDSCLTDVCDISELSCYTDPCLGFWPCVESGCIQHCDADCDLLNDASDNCPNTPNALIMGTCTSGTIGLPCDPWSGDAQCDTEMGAGNGFCSSDQEDTYPPGGNSIGDACDCESDFNCDGNVDASDVTLFLGDFGRSPFNNPCSNGNPCNGDFSCNWNVDAFDVNKFLEDFGRSQFNNPCPPCVAGDWCVYP